MPGVPGPVQASRDGELFDLGPPRQRALLAALALRPRIAVPVSVLIELVWRDAPPASVTSSLQVYISGLRRVLEPARAARGRSSVVATVQDGYALQQADEALARWRGTPLAELDDAPEATAQRVRLEDLRLVAEQLRASARLALGEHATVAAQLQVLTSSHPLREELSGTYALALARSGRHADALEELLRTATAGDPRSAMLVGDAGIGKTRLVGELRRTAGLHDVLVLTGRCSEDHGAPSLYPWERILRGVADVVGPSALRAVPGTDLAMLAGLGDRAVSGGPPASGTSRPP